MKNISRYFTSSFFSLLNPDGTTPATSIHKAELFTESVLKFPLWTIQVIFLSLIPLPTNMPKMNYNKNESGMLISELTFGYLLSGITVKLLLLNETSHMPGTKLYFLNCLPPDLIILCVLSSPGSCLTVLSLP